MNITLPDNSMPESARMKAAAAEQFDKEAINLAGASTPLAKRLTELQALALLDYVSDRWLALHNNLSHWRGKMKKWEKMSEMNYEDRVGAPNPMTPDAQRDVFSYQNDTLGMSEGFVDFFTAQARNDIFGTRPWLAATPEGKADNTLADLITKHAQWKLNQSNLETTLSDAIKVCAWGGTAFVKSRWMREEETFQRTVTAAHSISKKTAFTRPDGEFIETAEELETMGVDGDDVEWLDVERDETVTVHDNVCASLLDFEDVAFDVKAAELDLYHTDFFSRVRMGLLDAAAAFGIPEERIPDLRVAMVQSDEGVKDHRDESNATDKNPNGDEDHENPMISLVEGFIRMDPFKTGKPIRMHVIFSQQLNILFRVDYLANVTPSGMLPVFPVRILKIANRIFGVGYFEKYENSNNAVDRQHNAVTYRNRQGATIYTAFQPDALMDGGKDRNFLVDPSNPFELAPGKTIADLVQFATMPDMNGRSIELMNQQMQMAQMRSGITSAAQGELKGVPNAATATGVNQLQSRGAILLKDPIDRATLDIRACVEFNVHQIYANQDHDETFTWGEGEAAELLTIQSGDVQGLRVNVSLTLVQAQNQSKLQNGQLAATAMGQYALLPETEKASQRELYIQIVSSLGFNNAGEIVRKAAVDPAGIIGMLPPEIAAIVEQALVQAGVMEGATPPGEPGEAAPVTPDPEL